MMGYTCIKPTHAHALLVLACSLVSIQFECYLKFQQSPFKALTLFSFTFSFYYVSIFEAHADQTIQHAVHMDVDV